MSEQSKDDIDIEQFETIVSTRAGEIPLLHAYRVLDEAEKAYVWQTFREDDITRGIFGTEATANRVVEEWLVAVTMYQEFKKYLVNRVGMLLIGSDTRSFWQPQDIEAFFEKLSTRIEYLKSRQLQDLDDVDGFADAVASYDLAFATLFGFGGPWIAMHLKPVRSYLRFATTLPHDVEHFSSLARFLGALLVAEREDELWALSHFKNRRMPRNDFDDWQRGRDRNLRFYADGASCLSLRTILDSWARDRPDQEISVASISQYWRPRVISPALGAFAEDLWNYISERPPVIPEIFD